MVKANELAEAFRTYETVAPCKMTEGQSKAAASFCNGAKHAGVYFTPDVFKQLRRIAPDDNLFVQASADDGLNMLFESRDDPALAI